MKLNLENVNKIFLFTLRSSTVRKLTVNFTGFNDISTSTDDQSFGGEVNNAYYLIILAPLNAHTEGRHKYNTYKITI